MEEAKVEWDEQRLQVLSKRNNDGQQESEAMEVVEAPWRRREPAQGMDAQQAVQAESSDEPSVKRARLPCRGKIVRDQQGKQHHAGLFGQQRDKEQRGKDRGFPAAEPRVRGQEEQERAQ